MTIETQKILERDMLLNILTDIVNHEVLSPERAMSATAIIEHVAKTEMIESQVVKRNIIAGYGKGVN